MKNSFGIYHDPNAVAMMLAQLAQGHKMAGGSSKVIMKEIEDSGITIKARAICFPMLIHEINKGLHELISLQGFKGDKAANQAVVNKVDTLANEPNDIKYGQIIYEALNDLFIDSKYSDEPRLREYFLQDVYQLEDDEFLSLVENSINEEVTPQQRKWVDDTLRDIKDDLKADDYDSTGLDENKDFDLRKYLSENKLLQEIKVNKPGKPNEWNNWELTYVDDDMISLDSNNEDLSVSGQGDGNEVLLAIDNDELSKLEFLKKLGEKLQSELEQTPWGFELTVSNKDLQKLFNYQNYD
jgi:hypothetical protein